MWTWGSQIRMALPPDEVAPQEREVGPEDERELVGRIRQNLRAEDEHVLAARERERGGELEARQHEHLALAVHVEADLDVVRRAVVEDLDELDVVVVEDRWHARLRVVGVGADHE